LSPAAKDLVLREAKVVRAPSPVVGIALLGSLGLLGGGCGAKAPVVTGLLVTIELSGVADQLELSVSTAAGVALAPTRRPVSAGAPLPNPQSVSIYLPDALAGQEATCTVTAYAADAPTGASGAASTQLELHRLVPLRVALGQGSDAGVKTDAADGAPGGDDDGIDTMGDDGSAGDVGNPDVVAGDGPAPGGNGHTCATGGDCDSTLCVDSVCCASACNGLCETCNLAGKEGTCAPLPAGTATTSCANQPVSSCGFDGTCDGNGGCRRHPAGVACKPESCQNAAFMPVSACDGQGTCVSASVVDCTPYVCDSTGGAPACRAACRAGAADCAAPAVCVNASCGPKPKKADGAGCVGAADCTSAHCVDGVCCVTTCTGACQSCNQSGFAGTCRAVGAGKADPHAVCKDMGAAGCGTSGLCDGAGACALYAANTICAAGTCIARMLRNPKRCDGKGACLAAPDVDCLPYRCDPATTACFTSCTQNAQCAAAPMRRTCVANVCQ
jgi:hypothetical protein